MRSPLAKAVRTSFASRIKEELPQFSAVGSKKCLPGDLLYIWSFRPNLNFYIHVQISQKSYQDSFTVELACSTTSFPFSTAALGPTAQKDGAVRFRLPQLYRDEWRAKTGWEPWWWIGPPIIPEEVTSKAAERAATGRRPLTDETIPVEQALPMVEPQVRDAIDRLKRFAIPFFERFAQGHQSKD
jgi:hypothetical protein